MKSTDLHLGVKGFVEIDHLGAKWSRNSVVAQSFLRTNRHCIGLNREGGSGIAMVLGYRHGLVSWH
jgi:hypothetical protein